MRTLISILILTALAAPALAQGPPPPIPPPLLEGQGIALDGNTLTLLGAGPDGGDLTVRLFAIDVPAMDTPDGPLARAALDDLIGASAVACDERDIDQFGRTVATCFVGNVDVGEALIRQGRALVYRVFTLGSDLEAAYNAAELAARRDQLGIWETKNAEQSFFWLDRRPRYLQRYLRFLDF